MYMYGSCYSRHAMDHQHHCIYYYSYSSVLVVFVTLVIFSDQACMVLFGIAELTYYDKYSDDDDQLTA